MNFHLDLGKQPLDAGLIYLQDVLFYNKMNNSLGLFNKNLRLTLVKQKIESRSYGQMGPTHMVVTDFLHVVSNHNWGNL